MKKIIYVLFLFLLTFNLASCGKTLEETSITNNGSNFTLGTYYLPYSSKYDPIALRFDENNMMHYIFEDENNKLESCNYDIIDGYIYIYIGKYETEKYHVFEITNYGIVLDSKKTTANLWDNNIYRGEEVIFYLEVHSFLGEYFLRYF